MHIIFINWLFSYSCIFLIIIIYYVWVLNKVKCVLDLKNTQKRENIFFAAAVGGGIKLVAIYNITTIFHFMLQSSAF